MKEDLSYSIRRWIYKYKDSPMLYKELVNQCMVIERYMSDDSIPPLMKGQPKSRLDMLDANLQLKCRQHDFLQSCAMGNLNEAKKIVNLYKKPFQKDIINCVDENGWSGLDHSYFYLQPEITSYLLRNGAKETEYTPELRQRYSENSKRLELDQNSVLT